MKFLFDQSAEFRLMPYLTDLGHDVRVISRDYPHSLADEDVLSIANAEQRILLVADRDFGELIHHQRRAPAGVIYFRLPGVSLTTKQSRLADVLRDHAEDLRQGKFLVVKEDSIRSAA